MHRQALELFSPLHPNRSASLNNLASALLTRFQKEGQQDDLDEAILLHRQTLELQAPFHPKRSSSLNNLASGLCIRFEQKGQQSDFDEAILLHRQALELRPPPHPNRSASLNGLASVLWTQFEQRGQKSDLDEAISLHRQALELQAPPHPNRSASLNNLANALSTRFQKENQQDDLNEAILLHRQALELRAPPHPNRSSSLNNLASALSARFEQGGQQGDFNEAISLHRQALELFPPLHPLQSNSLTKLAILFMRAYSVTNNDPSHLADAMSSFSAAIQCLSDSPFQYFQIAQTWAYYADLHKHPSAIEAYSAALFILPQLAALSLDIHSRHKALTAGSDGLARMAARCAIQEGYLDKAVEYLDTGRAVFWSQLVRLRSPFDQLSPELANRLHNIAAALEHGSHQNTFSETLDNQKKMTLEEEASRLALLDKEWSQSINKV